jgi:23S rRNA pseudouridine2605 synthase
LCSRRKADDLIRSGRVKVNGKSAPGLNTLIDPKSDRLEVDGRLIIERNYQYILLNKPKGVLSTCADEKGRKSILHLLPASLRHLKPAGRLDADSQGLMLLTNDGGLIQSLIHPSKHVPKTYEVTVPGLISNASLKSLAQGIELDGTTIKAEPVRLVRRSPTNSCFQITVYSGKNRQVRRMCGALGLPVLNLLRVGIGELQLSGLESGAWRFLSCQEVTRLHSIPDFGKDAVKKKISRKGTDDTRAYRPKT